MKKIFIIIYLAIFGYIPVASAGFSEYTPLFLEVSQSKCIKASVKAAKAAGIPEIRVDNGGRGQGMNKVGYSIQFICIKNPRMLIYIINGPSVRKKEKMARIFFQVLRINDVHAQKKVLCVNSKSPTY